VKNSYLVQRLTKPHKLEDGNTNKYQAISEVFSFGGGYQNGGLAEDAMKLLRPIFGFDYMGAAEYEFGEVPKALSAIYLAIPNLASGFVHVKCSRQFYKKQRIVVKNEADIFYICQKYHEEEVKKRIKDFSKGYRSKIHTKEGVLLDVAICPDPEIENRNVGWLELDNGYFFFTDKEMFEKTAKLFEVK